MTIPDIKIQDVEHGFSERVLKVIWSDGSASRFPYVFLRENCKCSQCFHPSSSQRLVDTLRDIELNLNKVKEAAISESGDHLKCVWPDGHKSIYTTSWLLGRRMPEESERNSKSETAGIVKNEIILWDNELMQDKIPNFEYEAIMNDDKSLFNYLYALYQYGLVLVENAPAQSGVLLEVASRLGYHKPTHYG